QLERDLTLEASVFREVDLAHPTCAQQREHVVMAYLLANQGQGFILNQHLCCILHRACREKTSSSIFGRKQRLYFSTQRLIITASIIEKSLALGRRQGQRRLIKLADLLPPLRRHCHHLDLTLDTATPAPGSNHAERSAMRRSAPRLLLLRSSHRSIATPPLYS